MLNFPITPEAIFNLFRNLENNQELEPVLADFDELFSHALDLRDYFGSRSLQELQDNINTALVLAENSVREDRANNNILQSYIIFRACCFPFLAMHRDWWRGFIFSNKLTANITETYTRFPNPEIAFIRSHPKNRAATHWTLNKLNSIKSLNSSNICAITGSIMYIENSGEYKNLMTLQQKHPELFTVDNVFKLIIRRDWLTILDTVVQGIVKFVPRSPLLSEIFSDMLQISDAATQRLYHAIAYSSFEGITDATIRVVVTNAENLPLHFNQEMLVHLNKALNILTKFTFFWELDCKNLFNPASKYIAQILSLVQQECPDLLKSLPKNVVQSLISNPTLHGNHSLLLALKSVFNMRNGFSEKMKQIVPDMVMSVILQRGNASEFVELLNIFITELNATADNTRALLADPSVMIELSKLIKKLKYSNLLIKGAFGSLIDNMYHADIVYELIIIDNNKGSTSLLSKSLLELDITKTIEILQSVYEATNLSVCAYFLGQICSGQTYGVDSKKIKSGDFVPYDDDMANFYYGECMSLGKEPWASYAKEDLACFLGSIVSSTSPKELAYTLYSVKLADTAYRRAASLYREYNGQSAPGELSLKIMQKSVDLLDKTQASPYNRGALVLYRKPKNNDQVVSLATQENITKPLKLSK